MAAFTGGDLDLELGAVQSVEIIVVGGEVAVTAGTAPLRVRAQVLRGEPVEVTVEHGHVRVAHELPKAMLSRMLTGLSPEAMIEVVAPVDAAVTVRTVSAGIVVAGLRDRPVLATVSGTITASDVGGLTASAVSGTVEAQLVNGPLSVTAVSGDVTVSGGRLDGGTVKSVSGDVLLDVDAIGEASLTTVSGTVAVRVPEDLCAVLEATSVSGRLDCAFPLADSVSTKRRLAGAIGGGGPAVRVRTVSGDVTLLRRRMVTT